MDTTNSTPLLERLFTESVEDLTRYFSRRHGERESVRDLVQETFLQMARGMSDGRELNCARGYLFGIARRLSMAAWSERKELIPFDGEHGEIAAPMDDDRISAARETMAALEPIQREILDLRFSKVCPMRKSPRASASPSARSDPDCITPSLKCETGSNPKTIFEL